MLYAIINRYRCQGAMIFKTPQRVLLPQRHTCTWEMSWITAYSLVIICCKLPRLYNAWQEEGKIGLQTSSGLVPHSSEHRDKRGTYFRPQRHKVSSWRLFAIVWSRSNIRRGLRATRYAPPPPKFRLVTDVILTTPLAADQHRL